MKNIKTVLLAAGKGTRMKSDIPKVLHQAAGKALGEWVAEAALQAAGARPVLVVGAGADAVRKHFGDSVDYAVQEPQLGSGHAVMAAREYLRGDGYALIVAGDMPLLRAQTLKRLVKKAIGEKLGACLLSATVDDASGYGRIIRSGGNVVRIVEHRDATEQQKSIREINLSVYCFFIPLLMEALSSLQPANAQGEYYLTDCVEYLALKGHRVETMTCDDRSEGLGVNDKAQLAAAAKLLRQRINTALMEGGVTMADPDNVYIDALVTIEPDAVVYPGVTLEGRTHIGARTVLYPGSRITDSRIGQDSIVQNSVILASSVGNNSTIGPYAYLRPNSIIGNGCRVGDFVEVKNAHIKDGAKVSHLSYIGDGEIGEKANIGCGVVFVNYDGIRKNKTVVGENAFVGCNANLIAPVTIGDGAYIAAGTTVTNNVEPDSLCIGRSRQKIIPGWAKRRRKETD